MIVLHCKLNLHRIDGTTPHLCLINLIVNNAHIVEPFAPIVVRRVNQVIVHVNAALRQSTSSVAVITQSNRPIAFSRKPSEAQAKYSVTEIELLAIVETLKEFQGILWEQTIKVYTDHKNFI
jgi:hypothetical protein